MRCGRGGAGRRGSLDFLTGPGLGWRGVSRLGDKYYRAPANPSPLEVFHRAQAGVPIARLQKLLGHASPHMTLRYMKHAPESYFAEDAAKVAASISEERSRKAEAQATLAREGIRLV